MHHAEASGASGRLMVSLSSASSSRSSLAFTRAKCRHRGFIRNFLPSAATARLKWFATASCQPNSAASRNAAARSTRSCHSADSSLRFARKLVTFDITPSRAKWIRARPVPWRRVYPRGAGDAHAEAQKAAPLP